MKKKKPAGLLSSLSIFFGSNAFFYGVMAFLIVTSLWVAVSSLYPMAFDEDFHVGLIKLYAELWNPFAIVQTPETAIYGSITTDPSYLFHYLMSFPYRLLAAVTSSETAIIIFLRTINIVFFVAGVWLYRKVLLRAKISPAIVHVVLAVFVLIPVVPLLAGQINYDNLLLLFVAAVFWLTLRIREELRNGRFPFTLLSWLVIVGLFASVVKYAFLPIAVGTMLYVGYEIFHARKQNPTLFKGFLSDVNKLPLPLKVTCIGLFGVGLLLFGQRYGVNLVKYHDPVPDCAAVITVQECSQYGPWGRDYRNSLKKEGLEIRGPVHYTTTHWAWGMWHRLFFTLAGPTNGYATRKQLPIPSYTAIILVAGGVILTALYGRRLLTLYPIFGLFLAVGVVYVAAVWLQVYQLYVDTARPVAINGRYLIPLLPAFGAMLAVAYSQFFTKIGQVKFKGLFAGIILLLFLQGGGPITYIVRAEPDWYWPDSFVQDANQQIQKMLKPVIIGS